MNNSLDVVHPDLCAQWHPFLNDKLLPSDFSYGSNAKVWWKCDKGHEWQASIKSRSAGKGCPYCSNNRVLKGYNDLLTLFPELCSEWNQEKNTVLPSEILPGSHSKVWWKCDKGHEWQATPNKRTSLKRGCPFCCHNPRVVIGENDLETLYPTIASEWDYEKNGNLTPNMITAKSNKLVWWKCKKGHSWKTTPNHRADGSNCPNCSKGRQTSFPEQVIFYYVSKYYSDASNKNKELFDVKGMELDIYIPSKRIGIEYDGAVFHTQLTKERDVSKYKKCKEKGITLIRIKEDKVNTQTVDADVVITCTDQRFLNDAVNQLSKYLNKITDVDIARDRNSILMQYLICTENNSLEKQIHNLQKNGIMIRTIH